MKHRFEGRKISGESASDSDPPDFVSILRRFLQIFRPITGLGRILSKERDGSGLAFHVSFASMRFAALILILMLAFVMSAAASAGMPAQTVPPDDGFAPGLLIGVLLFGAVLLVLVGIGIVVGFACLACAVVFVALGVISSSALVAIFQRRFSSGLRALHYQLLALVGLPCGVGSLWLGCLFFDVQIRHRYILAGGSVIGTVAGTIIAFILNRFFQFVIRRFRCRLGGEFRREL